MEALLRRVKSVDREELTTVTVPPRGSPFGNYSVARASTGTRGRKDPRPYAVRLETLSPLDGSCDCPDFLRGSLGLCKHLLTVVHYVLGTKTVLAAALSQRAPILEHGARLSWDPVRPLLGEGDRLSGLRWI